MNDNHKLEHGCLMFVVLIVLGAAALYLDYHYKLAIVKEALKQAQQESQGK